MMAISYTSFRAQLAKLLDKVNVDHNPVLITRQNGSNAVVMSQEDFNAYEETAYLMQSTTNATRLNDAIKQLKSGQATQRELLD